MAITRPQRSQTDRIRRAGGAGALISVCLCLAAAGCGSPPIAPADPHAGHAEVGSATAPAPTAAVRATLARTRAATARFRDVEVARKAGYRQEGPSLAGVGAHFVAPRLLDAGVFDAERPTALLYERTPPDWSFTLVGVAWMLPKKGSQPPAAFAPAARWHYHDYPAPGICIDARGITNLPAAACTRRGGRAWRQSPWMLHAWVFRPSPDGVFSVVNPTVRGITIDTSLGT